MTGTEVLLRKLPHHLQIRDPKGPTRVVPGPLQGLAWTTLPSYIAVQATSEGPWGLWLTQKNGADSAYGKIWSHLLVPWIVTCVFSQYFILFIFYSWQKICSQWSIHSSARWTDPKGQAFLHSQNQLSQCLYKAHHIKGNIFWKLLTVGLDG